MAAKKATKASTKAAKLTDVAEAVSKETGWSMKESREAVKVSFDAVSKLLKKNDRVTLTGIGSFSKKVKPAQKGGKKATNPFTGESYVTKSKPRSVKVGFRAAKGFQANVDK